MTRLQYDKTAEEREDVPSMKNSVAIYVLGKCTTKGGQSVYHVHRDQVELTDPANLRT